MGGRVRCYAMNCSENIHNVYMQPGTCGNKTWLNHSCPRSGLTLKLQRETPNREQTAAREPAQHRNTGTPTTARTPKETARTPTTRLMLSDARILRHAADTYGRAGYEAADEKRKTDNKHHYGKASERDPKQRKDRKRTDRTPTASCVIQA